ETNPKLHMYAATLMGAEITGATPSDAGEILAGAIIDIMQKTGMPNGLSALGFTEADVDKLVEGTLPQHRVTKLSPKPAGADDLRQLFLNSMKIW
ncbi:MAG: iron-containing alcohol dehydrogenase, partial [Caldilineaceae bacterium]|nr:iron-containing alcohol dehydrogenase [Caldilineaceae bacterium]